MTLTSEKITGLDNIFKRLKESKKVWKTELVVFWDYALKRLEPNFIEKGLENTKIQYILPAFPNSRTKITAKEMYKFCTTRDDYLSYSYLVYLFSLFEEFLRTACKPKDKNTTKWKNVKSMLKKWGIVEKDIKELTLAKETRNCFVHHNGIANWTPWFTAFKVARKRQAPIRKGDFIRNAFRSRKNKRGEVRDKFHITIQNWQSLITRCSKKILIIEKGLILKKQKKRKKKYILN